MKKFIGLMALFCCVLLLNGCGEKEEKKLEYEYEQELNIIDDNYRTYYEVFVYSFCDSDGNGIGDLNGLTSKLDYIADMGFNGIWLMPIMPSTTYHKYDVVDYYDIDAQYGTLEDFENFISECNKRNIKVIIDLVINHSSNYNQWFQLALEGLRVREGYEPIYEKNKDKDLEKYIDYYTFVDGKPSSGEYHYSGVGNWYYEGAFVDFMPDLNLSNQELRSDMEDIIDYWLELGVEGFRLDAAKEFFNQDIDKNTEVLEWVTDYVKGKSKDYYLVAEVWDSFSVYSKYYNSGIDSIFNFAFADYEGRIVKTLNYTGDRYSGKAFGETMIQMQDMLSEIYEGAIDASFFTNHDTARGAGFFQYDEGKTKLAAGMNLLMSGTSFVYYGEEIGMSGSGRDENKRAPMVWSTTDPDGMTIGPADMETVEHHFQSVEDQEKDRLSILNYVKRAVRLRNENPEIARGKISYLEEITDVDLCAIKKTYEDSTIYIIYNFSEEAKEVCLSKDVYGYSDIRGYLSVDESKVTIEGDKITIPSYGIVILK